MANLNISKDVKSSLAAQARPAPESEDMRAADTARLIFTGGLQDTFVISDAITVVVHTLCARDAREARTAAGITPDMTEAEVTSRMCVPVLSRAISKITIKVPAGESIDMVNNTPEDRELISELLEEKDEIELGVIYSKYFELVARKLKLCEI